MRVLLVGECRDGDIASDVAGLFGFAALLEAEVSMVLVGSAGAIPSFDGRLWLADIEKYGEYAPDFHTPLLLSVIRSEAPDAVVFLHSSYGWDMAPRVAAAMHVGLISGVTGLDEGGFVVKSCNGKMERTVRAHAVPVVLTIQPGAFGQAAQIGSPDVRYIDVDCDPLIECVGFSRQETSVDLSRAEVIVSAGRGVGSKEHIGLVKALADALGAQIGASRPVVDAGWLERERQVGMSGQSVSPALYVACGISGSIQHLAGIKGAQFVLAINTDRDAPIGTVADVLVVADLVEFLPLLTAQLGSEVKKNN